MIVSFMPSMEVIVDLKLPEVVTSTSLPEGADHLRNRDSNPFLSFDLLCAILSRVDALTLAKASCVNTEFRRVCEDEQLWERLCTSRWPSTTQPAAKELITQTGGFRNFCARCHPSLSGIEEISPETTHSESPSHQHPIRNVPIVTKTEDASESQPSPSNFVSIVNIMYNNQPMFSRIIPGFPGMEEFNWFANCPFQFDLLETPDATVAGVRKDTEGVTAVTIPGAMDEPGNNFWASLNENMTASWILVNKFSGEMANLASWKSVGGRRNWPCEDEFVLHFGTVVPGVAHDAIHCNVALKAARYNSNFDSVTLSVTEIAMKMESLEGARLFGMESVALLGRALRCKRTVSHATVVGAYEEFNMTQLARKEEKIQMENRRELVAAFVGGFGAFLCVCYILL